MAGDCLGRTPFVSLIACLVVLVGMGIFCASLYQAVNITVRGIFEELFLISLPWLETIQIMFIIVSVAMGFYAILLTFFGYLATGATRQKIYSGAKCIMGGRVAAGFFLVVTHLVNLCWLAITSTCALPILAYVMLNSICIEEVQDRTQWYFDEYYCFNLSRFGIYINYTEVTRKNAICDDYELGEFCNYVQDAGPMYSLAFGASLLICCGMMFFSMALSLNYTQIKLTKEITEYKQTVALGTCSAAPY